MNTTDNALTEAERLLLARVNDCTKPIDAADRNGILKLIDRLAASQSSQPAAAPEPCAHDYVRSDAICTECGEKTAAAPIDIEARFIAEHGHRLAQLLRIDAFDIADRDAQIMAALKNEHAPAPTLAAHPGQPEPRAEVTDDDKVCAARYRWLSRQAVATHSYDELDCRWEVDYVLRGESFDAAVDAARAGEAS